MVIGLWHFIVLKSEWDRATTLKPLTGNLTRVVTVTYPQHEIIITFFCLIFVVWIEWWNRVWLCLIIKLDTIIGCEDKSGLGDATSAFLRGGFNAFLPYVESHGCLFLRNGSEVTKLKTKMPNIQILYHNYFGKDRVLWVGYDVI